MQARQLSGLRWLVLALVVAACAGGSGSSGFDRAEDTAIGLALSEQRCVESSGLTVCPADTHAELPTPTASATATHTFARTFGVTGTPAPLETPSPPMTMATPGTFPPTATTPTVTSSPAVRVDTGITTDTTITCVATAPDSPCGFNVPFAPVGFAPDTTFAVAVRTLDPLGSWTVGPLPVATGSPNAPAFDGPASVELGRNTPGTAVPVQIAVLAFRTAPASLPAAVSLLADTGANFAFVTDRVLLERP